MKSGFTLIELVLVLFIGSMLSTSLYMSFSLISKMVQRGNAQVRSDVGFGLVSNQLEKDLMGAFLPIMSTAAPDKPTEATAKESTEQAAKKTAPAKPATNKLERAFYCTVGADGNFGVLSFVTNNPLQVYSAERSGAEKPRVARVSYKLVPEKDKKTFALMRYESFELEYKAFESSTIRGYEIAQSIQSCKIELNYVPIEQNAPSGEDKKGTDKKTEQKKEAPQFVVVSAWDDIKKDAEAKEQRPNLPQFIRFYITQLLSNDTPLELTVQAPIFAWETVIRRSDITLIQQSQKQEEQAKQGGAEKQAAAVAASKPGLPTIPGGGAAIPSLPSFPAKK